MRKILLMAFFIGAALPAHSVRAACAEHCASCAGTYCVSCEKGWMASGGKCYQLLDHCISQAVGSGGVRNCKKCETGWIPIVSKSIEETGCTKKTVEHCASKTPADARSEEYFPFKMCSECETGYGKLGVSNDNEQCLPCLDKNAVDCFRYDGSTKCKSGYSLEYVGESLRKWCFKAVTNCKYYQVERNTEGYCSECNDGYTLSDDKLSCTKGAACPDNCKTCSNGVCTKCKDGYKANGTKCEKICPAGQYYTGSDCSACPAGTYSSAAGAEQCTNCPKGSYSKAGATSCTLCPAGTFASQAGSASCDACGYMTWSSKEGASSCNVCESISVSWGICCQCTNTGTCTHVQEAAGTRYACNPIVTTCPAGQYLNGLVCKDCPAIPNGWCKRCTSGTTCDEVECYDGFSPSADGKSCELSCPDNCKTCAKGVCTKCDDGYTLSADRTCEKISCPEGQYLSGSVCVNCSTIPNGVCQSCTSDNSCDDVKCDDGYTLSADGKSCVSACPDNCKTCVKGVCTECGDGYTLVDGQCNISCDRYNVGKGTCVECDENRCTDAECEGKNAFFNPIFSKCGVECEDNQYLDSSYTCRDCPAGQTSSGGWFSNPTNCYSCESIPVDGGTCTECKNGFCTEARCQDGYVPDSSKTACIAARAACESPLTISDDGCCCVK